MAGIEKVFSLCADFFPVCSVANSEGCLTDPTQGALGAAESGAAIKRLSDEAAATLRKLESAAPCF